MKKIVEYDAKELPSGQSGQAPMPLMPEPVFDKTPATSNLKPVGAALADVADAAFQIQAHNEAVLGTNIYNKFDIMQTEKLMSEKQQYQGDKALPVGDYKGFTDMVAQRVNADIEDTVANSGLSPAGKDALRKSLQEVGRSKMHQASIHEMQQRAQLEDNNIHYDLQTAITAIKSGFVKTDDDFNALVRKHDAMIQVMKPGKDDLKLMHRAVLADERMKFEKHDRERVAYNNIVAANTDAYGVVDTDKAIQMSLDPNNPHTKDLDVEQRKGLVHAFKLQSAQYEKQDEERKDGLIVDYLGGKVRKDDLLNDRRFMSLKSNNKSMIIRFVDAQERADRAEAAADRSEKRQDRQEQRITWQNNADQTYGDVLGKIAEGKYSNTTQIYNEMIEASKKDGDNPYILKKASEVMAIFNKIESSPDLRDGLKRINDAEKTGIFQKLDKDNPLGAAASMRGKLRQMYMTDPTFREEKVNQWLNEQLKDKAKGGIGALLNQVFTPRSQAEAEAINNQYGGNQATPDTVTVNGTTYKVGDTYNGYRYIGGGKWEK